jgi:hypothetical protein
VNNKLKGCGRKHCGLIRNLPGSAEKTTVSVASVWAEGCFDLEIGKCKGSNVNLC